MQHASAGPGREEAATTEAPVAPGDGAAAGQAPAETALDSAKGEYDQQRAPDGTRQPVDDSGAETGQDSFLRLLPNEVPPHEAEASGGGEAPAQSKLQRRVDLLAMLGADQENSTGGSTHASSRSTQEQHNGKGVGMWASTQAGARSSSHAGSTHSLRAPPSSNAGGYDHIDTPGSSKAAPPPPFKTRLYMLKGQSLGSLHDLSAGSIRRTASGNSVQNALASQDGSTNPSGEWLCGKWFDAMWGFFLQKREIDQRFPCSYHARCTCMCIFLKAASSKTRPGSILKKRDNEFGNASPVGMGQVGDSSSRTRELGLVQRHGSNVHRIFRSTPHTVSGAQSFSEHADHLPIHAVLQRRDSVDKSAHLDKRTASRILRPSKRVRFHIQSR